MVGPSGHQPLTARAMRKVINQWCPSATLEASAIPVPQLELRAASVIIPAAVVEALELKEGDEIEIHVAEARQLGIARKPGREELLKRLRAFRGRLPADFIFDRDDANAR